MYFVPEPDASMEFTASIYSGQALSGVERAWLSSGAKYRTLHGFWKQAGKMEFLDRT
jgi:hypothetical protein